MSRDLWLHIWPPSVHWTILKGTKYLGGGFDWCMVFEKQLNNFDAILFTGDMQWRETVERPGIRVGFSIQEEFDHPNMTTMGGDVESCQVVDGHLVNGCAMVQQDAGGVDVVALGSHVQRR